MADYEYLTEEDRANIAKDQVRQFEAEKFNHALNLKRLAAIPKAKQDEAWEAQKKNALESVETINLAIEATKAEAKSLEKASG